MTGPNAFWEIGCAFELFAAAIPCRFVLVELAESASQSPFGSKIQKSTLPVRVALL